jgi:ubiquinone/menaquinone biosynthesis C-methylase UbiE
MEAESPSILEHMAALADPTRVRMLRPLEQHELTVTDLCAVLQLPQSTVSRHLKTLADDGWVLSRRDGTSRLYTFAGDSLDEGARLLWPVIRGQVGTALSLEEDDRRLASVLQRRREKSRAFFSTAAGEWDRLRVDLFGERVYLSALLALLDERLEVADLGCGTGQLSALLAPYVARVWAIDGSAEMLESARARLAVWPTVDVIEGALEQLPLPDASVDAALISLVLHHQPDPQRVISEAARILKPHGRIVIIDMVPHTHTEYQLEMGHVWLGFSEETLRRYLTGAGLGSVRWTALPAEPDARGPSLCVATARQHATRRAVAATH